MQNGSMKTANKMGGRSTKITSELCAKATKVMLETGKYKKVREALRISESTFFRWLKDSPEFKDAIEQGRLDREKFKEKEFARELKAAFVGLDILLTGYTKTLHDQEVTELRDQETGELLHILRVVTTEREVYIRPNMRAIDKVLGPHALRQNIYLKSLESHELDKDTELYKLVFGELQHGEHDEVFEGIGVLRVQLDLIKLRLMEAHVQAEYDKGNILIDDWIKFTTSIRGKYATIADRMENRAREMLGGYSYQEIIYQVEQLWQLVINTVAEALGLSYKRKNGKMFKIPAEMIPKISDKAVEMIHERSGKKRFMLWKMPRQ